MTTKIKISFICCLGLILGATSCKKYLNVNTNPNVAATATVQTLLPAGQLYLGTALGVDYEIDGSILSQYWTESPVASQYNALSLWSPAQDFFSTPWLNLYNSAENLFQMYKIADSQKKKQYMAISLLLQAYTFELITDGYGDVPFTQALKGQYTDGHLVNAIYNPQDSVYMGIIAYIDSANSLLNPNDPTVPGSDDLMYAGNMAEWQKFSNSLMLRVLLRLSNVNPTAAQAGITALYANETGGFIGVGDDALINYGFNSANKNPLYAEEVGLAGTQNLVGSTTCVDSMNSNNDYRAYVFYEYLSSGTIGGVPQGFIGNLASGTYSLVSYNVAGDATNLQGNSATAPVILLSSWESLFLQAEVAARGWAAAGTDDSLFYSGISASFNFTPYANQINSILGVSGAAAYYIYVNGDSTIPAPPGYWEVYPKTGSATQKLRFIITQKWFAMCGNQGFESWSEWRRTGYPDFFVPAASNINGGVFPRRFLYPSSESTTDANFPGEKSFTTPVWWDTH